MNVKALGFIFARGGSKGVPRKNIRPLAGKPLIAHAIATALGGKCVQRVLVSTDCPEIAETARRWGGETPFMRPAELASDHASEWLAWRHAVQWVRDNDRDADFDVFVSIPCTAPLRVAEDVDHCVRLLCSTDADIVITVSKAARSPYFNMVVLDDDGNARLVIDPSQAINRRQDAPMVWDMTTVAYAARPDFILHASGVFDGKVRAVTVPQERALDIDTEWDFRLAECILGQSKSGE